MDETRRHSLKHGIASREYSRHGLPATKHGFVQWLRRIDRSRRGHASWLRQPFPEHGVVRVLMYPSEVAALRAATYHQRRASWRMTGYLGAVVFVHVRVGEQITRMLRLSAWATATATPILRCARRGITF